MPRSHRKPRRHASEAPPISPTSKLARLWTPEARLLIGFGILLVGAAAVFGDAVEDIATSDPSVQSDAAIFHALQGLRSPVADRVMIAVTELGDPAVVVSVSLAVALFLAWRRAWRAAAYCLCAGLGGWGLNTAVKVAMHRPRPLDLSYSGWSAFSFPSGHTTLNLVVYGFLAFLVARELRFAWRLPVALAAAAWSLLIAFSRLYLGAHWYSDVVGGLALGTSWLALLGFCYTRRPADRIAPSSLLIVAGLALALAGSVNVALRHGPDLVRYGVSVNAP